MIEIKQCTTCITQNKSALLNHLFRLNDFFYTFMLFLIIFRIVISKEKCQIKTIQKMCYEIYAMCVFEAKYL